MDKSLDRTPLGLSADVNHPDPPDLSYREGGAGDVPTLILPNQLIQLEAVGQTDVGRDRHHNEDFFVIDQQFTQLSDPQSQQVSARGIYILCDGMGGHAEGEVASALASETLLQIVHDDWQDELPDESRLEAAIYAANQTIYTANEQKVRSGSGRMGTTLVMALVQDTQVRIAHVGDSRLYRLTQRQGLEQLTIDHEVGQQNIKHGIAPGIAYARPDAYQLTQALGPRDQHALQPEVQTFVLTEDTLFLLCSDGLTDNDLLEHHVSSHLTPLLNMSTNLHQGVNQLINLANYHNGHDNITVIAVRMKVRPQA